MRCFHVLVAAGILVLGGCPQHEADISTKVGPNGEVTRRIAYEERDKGRTFSFFAQPDAPYKLDGKVATASFKNGKGRHGGIRFWTQEADAKKRATTRPSELVVEVRPLLIGRHYLYRERLDLGLDTVRFSRELPRWTGLARDIFVEAIEQRFPTADLKPFRKHVKEVLEPKVRGTVSRLHLAVCGLMRQWQNTRIPATERGWPDSPFMGAVLAEGVAWGLIDDKEANRAWAEKQFGAIARGSSENAEQWEGRFKEWTRGVLLPGLLHLDEAKRVEILTVLLSGDDEQLKEILGAVMKKRFPGDKLEALQKSLTEFAVAGAGVGIFSLVGSAVLEFRLELPRPPSPHERRARREGRRRRLEHHGRRAAVCRAGAPRELVCALRMGREACEKGRNHVALARPDRPARAVGGLPGQGAR